MMHMMNESCGPLMIALMGLGWLLGLLTLRGRARVLVVAGMMTCGILLAEIFLYLLLRDGSWLPPRPMYVEQSLFPLFLVSAATGYWGALRAAAATLRPSHLMRARSWYFWYKAKPAAAFIVVALVPAAVSARQRHTVECLVAARRCLPQPGRSICDASSGG